MPEVMPDVQVRATEIMAAAGARELHDGEVAVVGIGLPQVTAMLARRTHAPNADHASRDRRDQHGPEGHAGRSRRFPKFLSGDLLERLSRHHGHEPASRRGGCGVSGRARDRSLRQHQHDALERRVRKDPLFQRQRGRQRCGLAGQARDDDPAARKAQAAECRRSPHESRLCGRTRAARNWACAEEVHTASLPTRPSSDSIPSRIRRRCSPCIRGFDLEDVVANTGFPLQIPKQIPLTPLPTPEELRLLREEIDPNRVYIT